jgi:hypothetical protein
MTNQKPHCLYCDKELKSGRIDKKFCDDGCRNQYHNEQKIAEHGEIKMINNILKNNRKILKRLLNDKPSVMVNHETLLRKGFEFDYLTHAVTTKSQKNKYVFCYNYGYHEYEKNKFKVVKSFN